MKPILSGSFNSCRGCFGTGRVNTVSNGPIGQTVIRKDYCSRCGGTGVVFIPTSPIGKRKDKDPTL